MVTTLDEAGEMEGSEEEMGEEDVGMKAQRKFFPVVAARKSSRGGRQCKGAEVCTKSCLILSLF
jgi:hypothetical protein